MNADPKPPVIDRRALRTRRLLRDALIALMLERGWERLTVQDLCDRADVGRSTFYMHFADKEELLVSGFADLRKELNAQLRSGSGNGKPLGFARGLIEHVHEHQRLFRAFVGKRSGQTVQKQFRRMLLELVKEDLAHMPVGGDLPREAAVHYLAGGLLELLTWWLDGNSSVAPDAVESMFHRMSASALQTLRK